VTSRSTLKFEPTASATRPIPVVVAPPRLLTRDPEPDAKALMFPKRRRVWELSRHLHCSIVGTCLSSAELRHVLAKAGRNVDGMTEHELHGVGVLAAGRNDTEGKLLNKALEKRNRQAVVAFGKATSEPEVLALWRNASQRGEIPGAYWAALTHAAATDALVRIVFGEVHMLSHLVGAANRADIRRLNALEAENAELKAKLERQQRHLSDGLAKRDARISQLTRLLEDQLAQPNSTGSAPSLADDAMSNLAADQARRLDAERRRRQVLERRIESLGSKLGDAEVELGRKTELLDRLQGELRALETCLTQAWASGSDGLPRQAGDLTLLYVGGRAGSIPHLRKIAASASMTLLSHDGGVEERSGLLAGLVARADVVLFPVDCVSHEAAASLKRACRQLSKPFIPLRSSGISSFVTALREVGSASLLAT
jgi:hypothetical protein